MMDSESAGHAGAPPGPRASPKAGMLVDDGHGKSGKKRRGSSSSTSSSSPRCGVASSALPASWVLAALCLLSLGTSGYLGYREAVLEARLAELERRFDEVQLQGIQYPGVVVERLRRDVEQRLARRLPRAAPPREGREPRDRIYARSPSDCACPPGRHHIHPDR